MAKNKQELENMTYGRPMPSSFDLEQGVIGAVLVDSFAEKMVRSLVSSKSFYNKNHQKIFQAIEHCSEVHGTVDLMLVTQYLNQKKDLEEVGGAFYLVELTNRVGSAANVEYHATLLKQLEIRRKLIETSFKTLNAAFDESNDVFSLIDNMQGEVMMDLSAKSTVKKIGEASDELFAEMKAYDGQVVIGMPSGIESIDTLTGGWKKGQLIILAARPSMGKTMVSVGMAYFAARFFGKKVLFFSCEQSTKQILTLIYAIESGIETEKIERGRLTEEEWAILYKTKKIVDQVPFFIDDTPNASLSKIKAETLKLKHLEGIDEVWIDYLQLVSHSVKNGSRTEVVSEISTSLKQLARFADLPVIALAQLSRKVEERADKRPIMADLKESGSIEQDADVVCFLYRPEYYQIERDKQGNCLKNVGEFIVKKNRGGKIGVETIKIDFTCGRTYGFDGQFQQWAGDYNHNLLKPRIKQEIDTSDIRELPF